MATNKYYLSAGLQIRKDGSYDTGTNKYRLAAGLPKVIEAAAGGGPFPHHTRRAMSGGMIDMRGAA